MCVLWWRTNTRSTSNIQTPIFYFLIPHFLRFYLVSMNVFWHTNVNVICVERCDGAEIVDERENISVTFSFLNVIKFHNLPAFPSIARIKIRKKIKNVWLKPDEDWGGSSNTLCHHAAHVMSYTSSIDSSTWWCNGFALEWIRKNSGPEKKMSKIDTFFSCRQTHEGIGRTIQFVYNSLHIVFIYLFPVRSTFSFLFSPSVCWRMRLN